MTHSLTDACLCCWLVWFSAFFIKTSKEFDAVRLVVSAVMVTIGDVFLRKEATDIESEASRIYRTNNFGASPAWALVCCWWWCQPA